MLLDDLLARRLIVLTGKGGVGKSVVASALALAARDRGKRVLLVEVDAPAAAARALGGRRTSGSEAEVRPGLFAVNLEPQAVMDQYVRHVVPVGLLARKVLESPIYRRFFAAAPGLKELMVLGRIMVYEEARVRLSRRPAWDLIVVDAPATGHGLAFLKVPLAASRAVPVGPVGHNARRVLSLLQDPERTGLVIVAIPEEMAVVEALEFHHQSVHELRIEPAAAVLNGCHERRFTRPEAEEILHLAGENPGGTLERGVPLAAALDAGRRQVRRRRLTRRYLGRLRRGLPVPVASLPHLFRESLGPDDIQTLADRLEVA